MLYDGDLSKEDQSLANALLGGQRGEFHVAGNRFLVSSDLIFDRREAENLVRQMRGLERSPTLYKMMSKDSANNLELHVTHTHEASEGHASFFSDNVSIDLGIVNHGYSKRDGTGVERYTLQHHLAHELVHRLEKNTWNIALSEKNTLKKTNEILVELQAGSPRQEVNNADGQYLGSEPFQKSTAETVNNLGRSEEEKLARLNSFDMRETYLIREYGAEDRQRFIESWKAARDKMDERIENFQLSQYEYSKLLESWKVPESERRLLTSKYGKDQADAIRKSHSAKKLTESSDEKRDLGEGRGPKKGLGQ